ncbi:MAG TPA: electron transfer flavoprotein subunit alpha/FixB family protein [Candidatus Fimousia stercorigallinarum]|nr:electron transfer flavoprotein subunit alpha/FixB family protein [Candidatus Fimousia stercorigallinarum]
MIEGIYIYTEIQNGKPAEYTSELVSYAESLKLKVPIRVFGLQGNTVFYEAEAAKTIAAYLQKESPGIVLIPAVGTAKAIFARTAVLLDVGMTADCTELYVENGIFRRKKPAFGNEAMVVTEETKQPAFVTVVVGKSRGNTEYPLEQIQILAADVSKSSEEVLDIFEPDTEEIMDAEVILSIGRGISGKDGYDTAVSFAKKIGAAVGGTRPLVDQGMIPFEHQIGQTGCIVHPKCCIFAGVSGAIQHTEGVRDADVTIAVNKDSGAAIFSFADYGVVADGVVFMKKMMEKMQG